MPQLLILADKAARYERLLRKIPLPDLNIHAAESIDCRDTAVARAEIILGDPDRVAGVLSQTDRLKWVQSTFAGIDALCRPGLPVDYQLTGVKGVFGPLMSEYVFAHILAWERHLLETRRNQLKKNWEEIPYRRLAGLTLGICGTGDIGRQIAATGRHFGMRTVGLRKRAGDMRGFEKIFQPDALHSFLSSSDYVVVTLPATPETRGFIDAAALGNMKPSAVLMNIGRGQVIVQTDLIRALALRRLRGAVLDVFEEEPLPVDSPLWEMENVWVTPHNAAKSFPEDIVEIFRDNYMRFIHGRELKYAVDKVAGY